MMWNTRLSRRGCLRLGLGLGVSTLSPWLESLAMEATEVKKSVLVLWLDGGPSTIDLWDLKPEHAHGGPFDPISTTIPGIHISEHLPRLAEWMKELAIVRSVTSNEGDHSRAIHLAKTGYPSQGAIQFPLFGSVIIHEIGDPDSDLPGFVSIAPTDRSLVLGAGYLAPEFAPLTISRQGAPPSDLDVANLRPAEILTPSRQRYRLQLLDEHEQRFLQGRSGPIALGRRASLQRAVRLMRPAVAEVFNVEAESESDRARYGKSSFGQGCLLARRLVENGVRFIEISLGGWDTHSSNFEIVKQLSGTLDLAWSALLTDLQRRNLLDTTLIVCMGEFGRTPRINGSIGRDHWPKSWAVVLGGGGLRGGQVIGSTTADGTEVKDRPLTIPDLLATISVAVGVDPKKQLLSNVGRPIRLTDTNATVLAELL